LGLGQIYILYPASGGMKLYTQGTHKIVKPDGNMVTTMDISGYKYHFLVYGYSDRWYISWTN
jgi:hypothetical protein